MRTRDEIYTKIDQNDKFCIDQFEFIKEYSNKDREKVSKDIQELKEEF